MDNKSGDSLQDSIEQKIQQIWKQSPNLPNTAAKELRVAITRLTSLPFKDEKQKASLFESLQYLQGYHIIQIFNTWASRLQDSVKESTKSITEIISLFEMCSRYCYPADMSNRVCFEFYIRAVRFCFPCDPQKRHLSTKIVSMLLELIQILQEGKLLYPIEDSAKLTFYIKSTSDFFNELLTILESRDYDESDVDEIIVQSSRLARADAKSDVLPEILTTIFPDLNVPFDQLIPAGYLNSWIDLLQLTAVGDVKFILRLASEDPLHKPLPGTMLPLCWMVNVLRQMETNREKVDLCCDEERLDVFFRNMNDIFRNGYEMTVTSLKILSCKNVNDADLAEVYKLFFLRECKEPQLFLTHEVQSFESIRQLLYEIPEGSLVVKILEFCIYTFPNDLKKTELKRLLDLFTGLITKQSVNKGKCLEEKAERLLTFIVSFFKMPLIHFWADFLELLITIFPTSFDKIPDVQSLLGKAVQPASIQTGVMEDFRREAYTFLDWLSQQTGCSEKAKGKMVSLFIRCFDRMASCSQFSFKLIKSLCLCKNLSVEFMETFIQDTVQCYEHLEQYDEDILAFVSKVAASSQSLVNDREVFTELSKTLNQFSCKSKTLTRETGMKTFELIRKLAKAPLSSLKTEKIVSLLQLSRDSTEGLSCCLSFLQLVTSTSAILKKRAPEHCDRLFSAIFKTLNGSKTLCEFFSTQHHNMTELLSHNSVSEDVLTIWCCVVAGLLSVGTFHKKVDSQCCLPVFAKAKGFNSPFKTLLLYFELRLVFSRVICLSTDCSQRCDRETLLPEPVRSLVDALSLIVQSDVATTEAKLLLIHKVYLMSLSKPRILIGNILPCALRNMIPLHRTISHEDIVKQLDLHHILTILERPGMVEQLGKVLSTPLKSMYSILCSRISNPLTKDDVAEIYDCVASFKDVSKVCLEHMLPLLESATKNCSSVSNVIDLLKEVEAVICHIPPTLIPLTISSFSYLVGNKVTKEHRAAFIEQVTSRWESPCDLRMCVKYEIPHLLWKAYEGTSNGKGKLEAIDQIHEVIVRVQDLETHVVREAEDPTANFVRCGIPCCDLEKLALHSSLTNEDVALCFHLSSCYPALYRLKCFNSCTKSGTQIQDGHLTPKTPQQDEDKKTEGSQTLTHLLTPAAIAQKMIVQLRRLLGDDINLRDIAVQLWNSLFTNDCPTCPDEACKSSNDSSACDDIVKLFLSCLEKAPYFEVVPLWFDSNIRKVLSKHHVIQCSEVVLESCGWNGQNLDKEGHLQIQAEMIGTLEILRGISQVPVVPPFTPTPLCFRLLQPQLKSLLCILQEGLPLDITINLLRLSRIDLQAADTIATIASFWSCKKEAAQLLEEVQRLFKEDGMRVHAPLNDFVWPMLEACGRVYTNCSQILINKLDCLINLHDLDALNYGLDRLPNWRRVMTVEGIPAHVIDNWCVVFLFTPREKLSQHDVDAVLDLSPTSLQLVANASQRIKQCLFSKDVFQALQEEGNKDHQIKKCLRLARLLDEFINILKLRTSKETTSDAVVTKTVVEACNELCESHINKNKSSKLYRIHREKFEALFCEVFGKKSTLANDQPDFQEYGTANEASVPGSGERQPTSPTRNLPNAVYEPMLVLLRRWLSGIANKPTLVSHTLEIVQLLLSVQSAAEDSPSVLEELHKKIQTHILSFARNQLLISKFQAAGYNQGDQADNLDLWASPSVELACYLSKSDCPNDKKYETILTEVRKMEKEKKGTTKFVAVWENQFLENVKLCSERIPSK